MSRPTFRHEMISTVFLGLAMGVVLPPFTQLFASNSLGAGPWLLAILFTQVAFGNLFGTVLGEHLQQRRRIRYVVGARVILAVIMLLIAALPVGRQSAIPYTALLLAAALLTAIVLNVRASVWHSNYPHALRGQIISRQFIINAVAGIISIKLAGYAMDVWPWAHRLVYALAAAGMLASAYTYSKIRVRGERGMLNDESGKAVHLLEGFRLLRRDPHYGRFMAWQMLSGGAVLMTFPLITLMLTTDCLHVDFSRGTTALTLVPLGLSVLGAPFMGRLFDRMTVTRFRGFGAALWAASRALLYPALIAQSWTWVLIAFAVEGVARSTGSLAFNIGHTRFTRPENSQAYMGIHMTLQGIRGLTMPFLGAWLYGLMGTEILLLGAGVQFVAAIGFVLTRPPNTPGANPGGS